jgi:hypothetical protein
VPNDGIEQPFCIALAMHDAAEEPYASMEPLQLRQMMVDAIRAGDRTAHWSAYLHWLDRVTPLEAIISAVQGSTAVALRGMEAAGELPVGWARRNLFAVFTTIQESITEECGGRELDSWQPEDLFRSADAWGADLAEAVRQNTAAFERYQAGLEAKEGKPVGAEGSLEEILDETEKVLRSM